MSTVYRRPTGYFLSWYCAPGCPQHESGHRQHCVSLRTKSLERAKEYQRAKDKEIQQDKARTALGLRPVTSPLVSWTLQEFLDRYQQKVQGEHIVSPHTWTQAEYWALKSVLVFRGETVRVSDLTESWISDFESAQKRKLSPYTWNSRRATLKAIGNRAVSWKWLPENPFRHLTRAKVIRKRPKRLDQEQLPIVLKAIKKPFWQLVTLLFYATGLRLQEVCRLKKTDVRRVQGYINVETNKENKPKVIALTPAITQILDALEPLTTGNAYVVGRNGIAMHAHGIKSYYESISKKVGFKVSSHRFRHSHGTHRMEAGDNLKAVSETLGHANIKTTADFYLELNLQAQQSSLSKLPIPQLLDLVELRTKNRRDRSKSLVSGS